MDMDSKVTKEQRNTQHINSVQKFQNWRYSNFQIGTDYLLKNRHVIISSSIEPKCDLISYPCCTYIIYPPLKNFKKKQFWTLSHPPSHNVGINTYWTSAKNCHFLNPPTSFDDVMYEWPLTFVTTASSPLANGDGWFANWTGRFLAGLLEFCEAEGFLSWGLSFV